MRNEYENTEPIWYDGKGINEVEFARYFREKYPLMYVDGRFYARTERLPLHEDRIHFKNGTYYLDGKFIEEKEFVQTDSLLSIRQM